MSGPAGGDELVPVPVAPDPDVVAIQATTAATESATSKTAAITAAVESITAKTQSDTAQVVTGQELSPTSRRDYNYQFDRQGPYSSSSYSSSSSSSDPPPSTFARYLNPGSAIIAILLSFGAFLIWSGAQQAEANRRELVAADKATALAVATLKESQAALAAALLAAENDRAKVIARLEADSAIQKLERDQVVERLLRLDESGRVDRDIILETMRRIEAAVVRPPSPAPETKP